MGQKWERERTIRHDPSTLRTRRPWKGSILQRQNEIQCNRIASVHKSFHFCEAEHSPASWRMQQWLRELKVTQYHTKVCPTAEPWAANESTPAHGQGRSCSVVWKGKRRVSEQPRESVEVSPGPKTTVRGKKKGQEVLPALG